MFDVDKRGEAAVGRKVSEAMYNGMIYYSAKVWVGRLQRRCCCWGSLSLSLFRPDIGQKTTDFFSFKISGWVDYY